MIYLTDFITGSDTDVLADTRLSSIPYGGQLTIQAQAGKNDAGNTYRATIQLPDGKVPVDSQRVHAGLEVDGAAGGQLDVRFLDMWTFPAAQGGHFTIGFVETGSTTLTWRVVLRP